VVRCGDEVTAGAHALADPRVPAIRRCTRPAVDTWAASASACGVGGAAGQHAPSRPAVDPCPCGGCPLLDVGGPVPVGRGATADRVDRAAACGRSARRAPEARTPLPAHLRAHHAGGLRPVGGPPPAARRRRVPGAGQVAHAGAHPGRRRVDPQPRRAGPPRRALWRRHGGCSPAATPICCSREPTGGFWSRTPTFVARCGPRVWPGGLLVDGEVVGTWRRAEAAMTIQPWRPLSRGEPDAVAAEAASLPLPGVQGRIVVRWDA
jgi:hypothetical protein